MSFMVLQLARRFISLAPPRQFMPKDYSGLERSLMGRKLLPLPLYPPPLSFFMLKTLYSFVWAQLTNNNKDRGTDKCQINFIRGLEGMPSIPIGRKTFFSGWYYIFFTYYLFSLRKKNEIIFHLWLFLNFLPILTKVENRFGFISITSSICKCQIKWFLRQTLLFILLSHEYILHLLNLFLINWCNRVTM